MQSAGPLARWTVLQDAIPLFAERPSHPFVPLDTPEAIARRRGQGRPKAGASALPLTAASTVAGSCQRRGRIRHRSGFRALAAVLMACVFSAALHAESATAMGAVGNDSYAAPIAEATQRLGIPADWIRQIIRAESGGDPHAISPKGAMGLMQLMPKTWAELRGRYDLGSDPFDPHDNILAGTAYLRQMHNRYGSPGFLAAYHAGPGRYEDYRDRHRTLPPETQSYVAELLPLLGSDQQREHAMAVALTAHAWTRAPLFAVHLASTEAVDKYASKQMPSGAPTAVTMHDFDAIAPRSAGLFVTLSTSEHKP